MSKVVTKFDQRLNQILNAEGSVADMLENLDDEEEVKSQFPETVEYDQVPSVIEVNDTLNQDAVDDYRHVRNTLYGLIDRGTVALEGALIVARESEHPRAFEVASGLMRNVADISKTLLELQKSLKPEVKIGKQINQQNIYNQENTGATVDGNPKEIEALLDELDDLEDLE